PRARRLPGLPGPAARGRRRPAVHELRPLRPGRGREVPPDPRRALSGARRKLPLVIEAFVDALGADGVASDEDTLAAFRDPYTFAGWETPAVSAVLFPETVEQVQAIVRIANERRIPLWTSSQGRNLAYGGGAPRSDAVLVSLRRLNRILELNEELAYALVEPGISFFDLADAVRSQGLKLLI